MYLGDASARKKMCIKYTQLMSVGSFTEITTTTQLTYAVFHLILYHIIITIILEENFTEGRLLFGKNNFTVYNNI